jgi:hypothetical protein
MAGQGDKGGEGKGFLSSGLMITIVELAADNGDAVIVEGIDQTVLLIDGPGPEAGQVTAQLVRIAQSVVRSPLSILDERIDLLQGLLVVGPILIVLPGFVRELDTP